MKKILFWLILLFGSSTLVYSQALTEHLIRASEYGIIHDLAIGPDYLWLGTNSGIIRLDPDTDEKKYFPLYNVQVLSRAKDGTIYWAANRKFGWIKADSLQMLEVFSEEAKSIAQDQEGAIWIGLENKLVKWTPQTGVALRFGEEDGIQREVRHMVSIGNRLWIHHGSQLSYVEDDLLRVWQGDMLGITNILDMAQDSWGRLWVATGLIGPNAEGLHSALMKLNPNSNTWERVYHPERVHIKTIDFDCSNLGIATSTYQAQIFRFDEQNVTAISKEGMPAEQAEFINARYDSFRSKIWTWTKLQRDHGQGNIAYPARLYEKAESDQAWRYRSNDLGIFGVGYYDPKPDLVIADSAGMYFANRNRFFGELYYFKDGRTTRMGLPTGTFYGGQVDEQNQLWFTLETDAGERLLFQSSGDTVRQVFINQGSDRLFQWPKGSPDFVMQGDSLFYWQHKLGDSPIYQLDRSRLPKMVLQLVDTLRVDPLRPFNSLGELLILDNGQKWASAGAQLYFFDGIDWAGPVQTPIAPINVLYDKGDGNLLIGGVGLANTSTTDWSNIEKVRSYVIFPNGDTILRDVYATKIYQQENDELVYAGGIGVAYLDSSLLLSGAKLSSQQIPEHLLDRDLNGNFWFADERGLIMHYPSGDSSTLLSNFWSKSPNSPSIGNLSCTTPPAPDWPEPETPDDHITGWEVYPNPMEGPLVVRGPLDQSATITVEVHDLLGRVITSFSFSAVDPPSFFNKINLSDFQGGYYHVRVFCDDKLQWQGPVLKR
ncbi:MAG: hypothetical protein AAFP02_02065 [Bacteroidota bacterium]